MRVRRETSQGRIGWAGATATILAAVWLLLPSPASAQESSATLDFDTLEDEPAWIFSLRPALGVDPVDGLFPELGTSIGYQFRNHAYLGMHLAGRFTARHHLRLGARLGVFFGRSDLTFGLGASPGVLIRTEPTDFGACITWGSEFRIRLARDDFLLIFAEFDLLFEQLGFDDTTWLLGTGLGWSHRF